MYLLYHIVQVLAVPMQHDKAIAPHQMNISAAFPGRNIYTKCRCYRQSSSLHLQTAKFEL